MPTIKTVVSVLTGAFTYAVRRWFALDLAVTWAFLAVLLVLSLLHTCR
jgi:hypothetical protein